MRPDNRSLELVLVKGYFDSRRVPSWIPEHSGRLGIETEVRPMRLEIGQGFISRASAMCRSFLSRPVCVPAQLANATFLQFFPRPRGGGDRRSSVELESPASPPLCLSTLPSAREDPTESPPGGSGILSSDSSNLASSMLVSTTISSTDRLSSHSTTVSRASNRPRREGTSSGSQRQRHLDRLDSLRTSSSYQRVSEEAFQIIAASWRRGTEKSYASSWTKWVTWCNSGNVNPLLPSIEKVINFLTEAFHQGYQNSTMNLFRSALSASLPPLEGYPVGQHPLVIRLLQGIFNSRPPTLRYEHIWKVLEVYS